jgi:hypothetical protein
MIMNTKKNISYGLTALLFAVVFAFIFTACPEKNDDDKKCECPNGTVHTDKECDCEGVDCNCDYASLHDDSDVPMFGTSTARIMTNDNFTVNDWNKIKSAIAEKFDTVYNTGNDGIKLGYKNAFDVGITIIVQKDSTDYTDYKLVGHTLYVKVSGIDNLNPGNIASGILGGNNVIAKALPARETPRLNRQAIAFGNEKARIIGQRV